MKGGTEDSITLTDRSTAFVVGVLVEGKVPQPKLRVSLKGGGCVGVQYKFSLAKSESRGDMIFVVSGVHLLIDCISYQYIRGSVIDYESIGSKLGLIVHNPNATITCSCGSSFTV